MKSFTYKLVNSEGEILFEFSVESNSTKEADKEVIKLVRETLKNEELERESK